MNLLSDRQNNMSNGFGHGSVISSIKSFRRGLSSSVSISVHLFITTLGGIFKPAVSMIFSAHCRCHRHLPARDHIHIQTPKWRGAASLQGAHSRRVLLPELLLDVQRERGPRGRRGVIVGMRSTHSYARSDTYTLILRQYVESVVHALVRMLWQLVDSVERFSSHQLSDKCWADGCGRFDTCTIWVLISLDFTFLSLFQPECNWVLLRGKGDILWIYIFHLLLVKFIFFYFIPHFVLLIENCW